MSTNTPTPGPSSTRFRTNGPTLPPVIEDRFRTVDEKLEAVRVKPGMGLTWYGIEIPVGWLKRDGTVLQVQGFSALYSVLGNKYGGRPGATFGLPSDQPSEGIGIIKT